MYVKCCGIMDRSALQTCEKYGADAVGFVHYHKSRRHMDIDQLKTLLECDAHMDRVAVMVNPTIESINRILTAPINCIQFHGDESPEVIENMRDCYPDIKFMKALPATPDLIDRIEKYLYLDIERFVIDTPTINYGGSGRSFDWDLLEDIKDVDYIIAGGLDLSKVKQIEMMNLNHLGYDISSGIESDGKKDIKKIKEFLQYLKG